MGLFDKFNLNIDDIESVIIIEQTQNYSKKSKSGFIFGESILNPNVIFMDGNPEPSGCTYKFSVTFKNGNKQIIKANSGTSLCDKLLQKALDGETSEHTESTKKSNVLNKAPELKKINSHKEFMKWEKIYLPEYLIFIMFGVTEVSMFIVPKKQYLVTLSSLSILAILMNMKS